MPECPGPLIRSGHRPPFLFRRKTAALVSVWSTNASMPWLHKCAERYPHFPWNECIDFPGEADVFYIRCKFKALPDRDGRQRCWADDDRHPSWALLYSWMQLGPMSTSVTFQQKTEVILALVKWQHGILYMDEAMMFLKTLKQSLQQIFKCLRLLQIASTTIKLKTCFSSIKTIVVSETVTVSSKLRDARTTGIRIELLQYSTTVSKLLSFLGLEIV